MPCVKVGHTTRLIILMRKLLKSLLISVLFAVATDVSAQEFIEDNSVTTVETLEAPIVADVEPDPPVTVLDVVVVVPSEEQQWLAKNIYYEARGESERGMRAVAHVTLNRTKSPLYPDTIKKVVTQRSQFSWVGTKKSSPSGSSWELANRIAEEVLRGIGPNPVGSALSFHNKSVRPSWASRMKVVAQIGGHVFYRP